MISNLCCQEKQGSQRFSPKLLFKKSFRAKQPPSVHLPCIAQSDALVRHKSLSQSDGLGSGTSKFTKEHVPACKSSQHAAAGTHAINNYSVIYPDLLLKNKGKNTYTYGYFSTSLRCLKYEPL